MRLFLLSCCCLISGCSLGGNEPLEAQLRLREDRIRDLQAQLTEAEQVVAVARQEAGKVSSVKDFGAFIEIAPGKDGLCHISELSDGFVKNVADICKVGDTMEVKVIAVDDQNRVKLSRKVLLVAAAAEAGEGDGDGGEEKADD